MVVFLIILAVIITVAVIIKYVKGVKFSTYFRVFSGTPGSGKTLTAVQKAVNEYKISHFLWKITPNRNPAKEPILYSNIPICLKRKGKNIIKLSTALEREHLRMEKPLTENCIVLIDELSTMADQHQYDDPNICERLGKFFKFYRHFTGKGHLYITEQAPSCITKPIRDKLGEIVICRGMRRMWGFMPFAIVKCGVYQVTNGEIDETAEMHIEQSKHIIYYLPYFSKGKLYNSRCYKHLYYNNAQDTINAYCVTNGLYTNYLLDLTSEYERQVKYRKSPEEERKFLYTRFGNETERR